MIWQFGELGYDISIFTCEDGSNPGDDSCKLSPKPDGWDLLNNAQRLELHNSWMQMIQLKKDLPIFETSTFTVEAGATNLTKKIHLTSTTAAESEINFVTVLANFGLTVQTIIPDFQETGTWYNLMNNESYEVSSTTAPISLEPGDYRIFANKSANLSLKSFDTQNQLTVYPNPATQHFKLTQRVGSVTVYTIDGTLIKKLIFKDSENQEVDVSDLNTGLYLVKTRRGTASQTLKLLVK